VTASRPADRYGRAARAMPSRRVLGLLAALVVLAGLAVAYLGYRNLGDPPISGAMLAFNVTGPQQVLARFAVHRDHPQRPASCVLRARAQDGAEVGRVTVPVPPGAPDVTWTAVVPTSRKAVIAEVFSCGYLS
jgi:Domain of unknown function (DUF4307)